MNKLPRSERKHVWKVRRRLVQRYHRMSVFNVVGRAELFERIDKLTRVLYNVEDRPAWWLRYYYKHYWREPGSGVLVSPKILDKA